MYIGQNVVCSKERKDPLPAIQNESAIQYCVLSFDLSAKPLEILITDLDLSFLVRSENTCMHSISNELQWLGQCKKDAEMMKS